MSKLLRATIDYFVENMSAVAMRDQPARVRATVHFLDDHDLWEPTGLDAKHASAALQQSAIRLIYNMFADAVNEQLGFRKWDRACGADCARIVKAFRLEKHRLVKEFWTYSKHGLGRPIPSF